jgi:hypothetical protein
MDTDYVLEIETRTTADGEYEGDWVILYCDYGDTYQAFYEGGGWWIQTDPGEPSNGPFETIEDVIDWMNNGGE